MTQSIANEPLIELLLQSMRPKHWVKNILIFVPLVFARQAGELIPLFKVAFAFVLFCGLSGAAYLINDVVDRRGDHIHKTKAERPIAAGTLAPSWALSAGLVLIVLCLLLSFLLDHTFGIVAAAYIGIHLLYSLVLQNVVIVDLFAVAAGYVLRVVAGAVVIHVTVSNWLLICTMLLSLFIALSKRSLEIRVLEDDAVNHRKILAEYNLHLLDQMTAVITSALLVAYTLYTRSPETVGKFETGNLIFTVPFALYGIFRYLYLVHVREGYHTLERVLITDKSMIINMVLYALVVLWAVYF